MSQAKKAWMASITKHERKLSFSEGFREAKAWESFGSDLIPKHPYISGRQGKDSRPGGLKNLGEYEEIRSFN